MKFELTDEIKEYLIAKEEYRNSCNKVNTAKNKLSKHFKPLFYFDDANKNWFTVRPESYEAMRRLGYRKETQSKPFYHEIAWYKCEKKITRSEYYETNSYISNLTIHNNGGIEEGYIYMMTNVSEEDKERIKEFLLNEYLKIVNKEQLQ